MPSKEPDDAKGRIFVAAVTLFARKGYAGVGVREIAAAANVNLSMISYYYGGKAGILKEIIDSFFIGYTNTIQRVLGDDLPLDNQIRKLVRTIVELIKTNPDLCKVAFFELPYDMPEIAAFKAEKVAVLKDIVALPLSPKLGANIDDPRGLGIIGPAFISMIFSHFLLRDIVEKVFKFKCDEAFYERYADTLATIFLSGITGLAQARKH